MPRARLVWPGAPEPGHRAGDDARVDRLEARVVDAEAGRHARPEAVDDHVGALDERAEDALAVLVTEVDGGAALVAPDRVVGQRARPRLGLGRAAADVEACDGARRHLDHEHVGAEVGEKHGGVLAGRGAGEVEDANALERHGHGEPPRSIVIAGSRGQEGSSREVCGTRGARRMESETYYRVLA